MPYGPWCEDVLLVIIGKAWKVTKPTENILTIQILLVLKIIP
jgi:hypothetical protein